MLELLAIEQRITDNGHVHRPDLRVLQEVLYADGRIDREEANFLVELRKRVQVRSPSFERFFYKAIKDHLLADHRINAAAAPWLRQALFADGECRDEDRQFLHQLKGEAEEISPGFETLFNQCVKQPPQPHTAGVKRRRKRNIAQTNL